MRKLLLAAVASVFLAGAANATSPLFANVDGLKLNSTEDNQKVVGKGSTANYYGYYGNYYNNLAGYYGNYGLYANSYSYYYNAYYYANQATTNYYYAYYYSLNGF